MLLNSNEVKVAKQRDHQSVCFVCHLSAGLLRSCCKLGLTDLRRAYPVGKRKQKGREKREGKVDKYFVMEYFCNNCSA